MMQVISSDEDIQTGLEALLSLDPSIRHLADEVEEIPLRRRAADFEGIAQIVTGQQVSVASASAIFARLRDMVSPLTAEQLARFEDEDLANVGLSKPKIRTLRAISQACSDGLDFRGLAQEEAALAHKSLCEIKGVGPWTADIFLLFCAGHPDIFPSGDLALQIAVGEALALKKRPTAKELDKIALRWSPYRAIAARLFWAWYKVRKQGKETMPL